MQWSFIVKQKNSRKKDKGNTLNIFVFFAYCVLPTAYLHFLPIAYCLLAFFAYRLLLTVPLSHRGFIFGELFLLLKTL
jgi:hypothetical protein